MNTTTTAVNVTVLANELSVAQARLVELQDVSVRVVKREKKVAKAIVRVRRAEKALKKGVSVMKTAEKKERRLQNKKARARKVKYAQLRARALLRTLTEMAELPVPSFLQTYAKKLNIQFYAGQGKLSIGELFEKAKTLQKQFGPKNTSFNLSADVVKIFFFDKEKNLVEMAPHHLKNLVHTDSLNQMQMNEDARLFVAVEGSSRIQDFVMDKNSLVQRNSESLLVRDTAKKLQRFRVTKRDPLNRKDTIVDVIEAYDNTRQLNVKVTDIVDVIKDLFDADNIGNQFGILTESVMEELITNTILNGVLLIDERNNEFKVFTLNSAAPSQTRKGEAAFWQYGVHNSVQGLDEVLFNEEARSIAVYGRFNDTYRLKEYGSLKEGLRTFKMDKEPKRLEMPASGSRESKSFGQLVGKLKVEEAFDYRDDEKTEKDKQAIVLESVNKMMGGVKRRILIIQDPIHNVKAVAKVVKKYNAKTGKPSIEEALHNFDKNLVDGGILVSHEFTQFMVAEGLLEHEGQSFQGRGVAGVKPFAYGVPMIKEITGFDAIFMSGALKLDVLPAMLEGRFEFSVVQGSRREFEKDIAPVATQALLAAGTPKKNLKRLHQIAQGRVHAAMDSPAKALRVLNISDSFDENTLSDGTTVEEMNEIIEGESGIKAILKQSVIALKDGVIKQRLASLMTKALEKMTLGNVLVDDTKMRHMGFDIFMVLKAVQSLFTQRAKGVEVPQMEWVASIPAGCAVVVDANGNLRIGEFLAIRYPALKAEEVRKVLATATFGSEEARAYYEAAAKAGYFQGLVLFNSVDMTTEAMSGADFDGDTCLVIFNRLMVKPFSNLTPLLDFYIKEDGTLEGGCPWAQPKEARDLLAYITLPEGLEVTQKSNDNGLTWTLVFKEEDVKARPQDVYYVFNRMTALHIIETSKASSIGLWTNRLMNIEDIMLEIESEMDLTVRIGHHHPEMVKKYASLVNEHAYYNELATWLTCVVRWAIDEAKHGGAFNKPLEHVLNFFENAPSPTKIKEDIKAGIFKMGRMF